MSAYHSSQKQGGRKRVRETRKKKAEEGSEGDYLNATQSPLFLQQLHFETN